MADVVMPQMGESIAEGTIVRWIRQVGDTVGRDEPLFEISTDKVDAEIPSPVAGVVIEIRAKAGETVPINSVVAVIGDHQTAQVRGPASPSAVFAPPGPVQPPLKAAVALPAVPPPAPVAPVPAPARPPSVPAPPPAAAEALVAEAAPPMPDAPGRQKSSPLVRRIAKQHQIDIAGIQGSGLGGRVTKHDILGHIEQQAAPTVEARPVPSPTPAGSSVHAPAFTGGDRVEIVPMSIMRKKIAEHMIFSRRTSAHVHSVFEVDYTRVARIREAKKAEYEASGAKLTYMSFILKAAVDALKAVPVVNASLDGDNIVYKKDINIGVAVALDWGLIVPVVKQADEKNILGLSRAIQDLATRARAKQLKPDEVQGGTFTITNPGVFGAAFGMPIISQPQVAILGVGNIEKRVAVIDDAIAIRLKGYLSLGYDHRLVDGAVADQFMSHVKNSLETFDALSV
jgi:pyruvate dehydrogenase E2 component (dihydrolipoamide acetyltransferase)